MLVCAVRHSLTRPFDLEIEQVEKSGGFAMSSCPALSVSESSVSLPQTRRPLLNISQWTTRLTQWLLKRLSICKCLSVATLSNVWLLLVCKATIGCVAAFDTYLTIKYAESLDTYEQNPLGRWLMGLDQGPICETQQIAAFITAKFLGTLLVLIVIQGLAFWRVRVAGLVATPLALAQLYLVAHLLLGDG